MRASGFEGHFLYLIQLESSTRISSNIDQYQITMHFRWTWCDNACKAL